MRSSLDFLVIGAQKSGTTSLFRYLQRHPDIVLPVNKEAPFFVSDDIDQTKWLAYLTLYFGDRPENKVWGKLSPQYMSAPAIPARLHTYMPNVKLIAILRNPVDRAISGYKQFFLRERESRDLATAMTEQLAATDLVALRNAVPGPETDTKTYLTRGEYGRLLKPFFAQFRREQILVLFMDELERDPKRFLDLVTDFLGLPMGFRPDNIGKVYLKGGTKRRSTLLHVLFRTAPARALLRCLPKDRKAAFWFWLEDKNTAESATSDATNTLESGLRDRLVNYFRDDIRALERLIERPVPWDEFR